MLHLCLTIRCSKELGRGAFGIVHMVNNMQVGGGWGGRSKGTGGAREGFGIVRAG